MGIRYLGHVIDTFRWANVIHLSRYRGCRVAIDTNLFLYKLNYQYGNIIDGLFLMMNKMMKHRICPIFVFDGRPPSEKGDIIAKRRRRRDIYRERYNEMIVEHERLVLMGASEDELESHRAKMVSLERKLFVVTRDVVDKAQEFIEIMGFPWVRHECEAEHLCAYLSRENLVDAVITDDMDALACGARVVLRAFSTRHDTIEEIRLIDCLRGTEMTFPQFQRLCVMIGTEYGPYEETVVMKDDIPELIGLLRDERESNAIVEYAAKHDDFRTRVSKILEIFQLTGIELDYGARAELFNTKRRNREVITEYMRAHSSLPEETVKSRLSFAEN
jgi:hypothetical protein